MTFWPWLSISRKDLGNQVSIQGMVALSPALSAESRDGSSGDSQAGWRKIFAKCMIAYSQNPWSIHVAVWGWAGAGGGLGNGLPCGGDGYWVMGGSAVSVLCY